MSLAQGEFAQAMDAPWFAPENVVRHMFMNPHAFYILRFVDIKEAAGAIYVFHDREIPKYRLN